jgi:hypothetical protein
MSGRGLKLPRPGEGRQRGFSNCPISMAGGQYRAKSATPAIGRSEQADDRIDPRISVYSRRLLRSDM